MKVHRYSEHQRRMWVHEMVHKTKTVKAICKEAAISRATLYNWLSESKEAKNDVAEGNEATPAAAWQPNDKYKMLLSALVKTDIDKAISHRMAKELVKRYNLTIAQACALVSLPEEAYNYRPRKPEADDKEVYAALVHLLEEEGNRSLEDCIAVLQAEHPQWAIKQIKRIYRQGRLYLKRTRIRRIAQLPASIEEAAQKVPLPTRLVREGAFWHMGAIEYVLPQQTVWVLFLLDYNNGIPLNGVVVTGALTEARIVQFITSSATENGMPRKIRIPATAPFTSRELSKWSWENKVAVYNLSMLKPENLLEADYITGEIKKQLSPEGIISAEMLQKNTALWIAAFAANSEAATPFFMREPIA